MTRKKNPISEFEATNKETVKKAIKKMANNTNQQKEIKPLKEQTKVQKRKKFTTSMNPDLHEKLRYLAFHKRTTIADILEQLVSEYVAKNEDQ